VLYGGLDVAKLSKIAKVVKISVHIFKHLLCLLKTSPPVLVGCYTYYATYGGDVSWFVSMK
jgi:hypothetical protein